MLNFIQMRVKMKIRLSPSSSVDPWLPLTDAVGREGHTGEEPELYQCRFVPCSLISPPITIPLPTALWLTGHLPTCSSNTMNFRPPQAAAFAFLPGTLCPWVTAWCSSPVFFISACISRSERAALTKPT